MGKRRRSGSVASPPAVAASSKKPSSAAAAPAGITSPQADGSAASDAESDESGCVVCGTNDAPQRTLLCDRCDRDWHMTCLNPPLCVVPLDAWVCPHCEQDALFAYAVGEAFTPRPIVEEELPILRDPAPPADDCAAVAAVDSSSSRVQGDGGRKKARRAA